MVSAASPPRRTLRIRAGPWRGIPRDLVQADSVVEDLAGLDGAFARHQLLFPHKSLAYLENIDDRSEVQRFLTSRRAHITPNRPGRLTTALVL